jgi:hypothetical protein
LETILLVAEKLPTAVKNGNNLPYWEAMIILAGLTCPIANPLVTGINTTILAASLSLGKDEFGMPWIKGYR